MLASVHWIAEPWDTGAGGYQLGRFPGKFLEWNDKFRDAVRGYWLGKGVSRGEFARRFTGSSDIFHHGARQPTASVNFVAAHDGFTLADTVSYAHKHNAANGEDNRDGHSHETSANFGVEGDTDDVNIRKIRLSVRRAMQATVLLAQGTPMLCAGDEFGNSQHGNNNAYCQDNATGWLDWPDADTDAGDMILVSKLIALRQAEPLLRHARWFGADSGPQLHWHRPDGGPMQITDWHDRADSAFACALQDEAGQPRWCLLFNPGAQAREFHLARGPWQKVFDSTLPEAARSTDNSDRLAAPAHSLLLLACVNTSQEHTP